MGAKNAARVIWMTNDTGGYIRLSDIYLRIKFSDSDQELEYRINGREILEKFRKHKRQFNVSGGRLVFLFNELEEEREKLLVIEIKKSPGDNFRVVVPVEEVKQVLNDFIAAKVIGW